MNPELNQCFLHMANEANYRNKTSYVLEQQRERCRPRKFGGWVVRYAVYADAGGWMSRRCAACDCSVLSAAVLDYDDNDAGRVERGG